MTFSHTTRSDEMLLFCALSALVSGCFLLRFLGMADTVIAHVWRLCSKWGAPTGSVPNHYSGVTAYERIYRI